MYHKNQKTNYLDISYDDLVVYSLFILQKREQHATFENLVYQCFTLFPKRFQLPGYSSWPDASLIERSWLRCRTDKGLMHGSKSKGFTLTQKGILLARDVENKLEGKVLGNKRFIKKDMRSRSGKLVNHVEKSSAYNKFLTTKSLEGITDFEFCDLLYSTLDTESSLRKRNLEELKYHVGVYDREDLLDFLNMCEIKFQKMLIGYNDSQYQGGMMKRRKK